jgi:hypothetical protein
MRGTSPVFRSWPALAAALLAACSGSDAPNTVSTYSISGTVAVGSPVANAPVIVYNNQGAPLGTSAATDLHGHYEVSVPVPGPYILEVVGPSPYGNIYSFSIDGRPANITPLTTLLLARLAGRNLVDIDSFPNGFAPSDAQIAAARADLVSYLLVRRSKLDGRVTAPVDVSAVADFFSVPFVPAPGDPYDDALTALAQSFMAFETLAGVQEHMLHAHDPPADLMSLFPAEFQGDCFSSVPFQPSVPIGVLQISFKTGGQIVIGSKSYALGPGDVISLRAPEEWALRLTSTVPSPVQIVLTGTLLTVFDNVVTVCFPVPNPSFRFVLPQPPSVFAMINSFAGSLDRISPGNPPPFSCPASPVFPGVSAGPNIFIFDPNGALRVNDHLTGYAFHLPSMPNASLDGQVVVGTGGLTWTARSFFAATGNSGPVFDSVFATWNDTSIIAAAFTRERPIRPTFLLLDCPQ